MSASELTNTCPECNNRCIGPGVCDSCALNDVITDPAEIERARQEQRPIRWRYILTPESSDMQPGCEALIMYGVPMVDTHGPAGYFIGDRGETCDGFRFHLMICTDEWMSDSLDELEPILEAFSRDERQGGLLDA